VQANRLIDSKLRLLALDIKAAEIALRSAESKWNEINDAFEANVATQSEVDKYRAARDTAELDVERAQTLYNLFKSIKDVPPATDGTKLPED
jgi:multidrug resistance efflux pump